MSTIVVTANTEGSVLPTDTPVSSVFGNDMSVKDTPRTVTQVSTQLLADTNIQALSDFVKVAPSAYSTDEFGVSSVPVIRGIEAEVFINGMQRTTRSDGPSTNFNAYESVNIVNGPASSVLGPTANTGGYVDLITKQPYFDKFHSDTEFTYGSYDTKRWTEDFGGPITPDLAYRASYWGNYDGSYYNNIKTQENDFFFAMKWIPNKDFTVDMNSDFYVGRFNENTGWNRPTQGLIDGHQYSTGFYQPFTGTIVGGTGVLVGPGTPTGYNTFGGLINSPGTVTLSKQATLITPNDSDYGKDANFELKETYNANDDLSFVNHTYWEYFELRNYEIAQLYVNQPTSNIVQDRFEIHYNFDIPISGGSAPASSDPKTMKDSKQMAVIEPPLTFHNEIVAGVAGKYVNAIGYGDFFNESLNATDLSSGYFPSVNAQTQGANSHVGLGGTAQGLIPGKNFYGATGVDIPNTYTNEAEVASAFFQDQITFTPQWSMIYSGRGDLLFNDLGNPVADYVGDGGQGKESTTQLMGTGDVSISYKPESWLTAYTTFDFNQSAQANTAGGYGFYAEGAGGTGSYQYQYQNFLYEGGVKVDLLDHTLYASWDGYYQTHVQGTALGGASEVRTIGSEISTTYQPNKNFYITVNESYLSANVIDPGSQFTENVYDAFSKNSVGVNGTGVGAPNFTAEPAGHYRESGLPQMLFTGTATYRLDCGAGATLGYVITDPIPTSEAENVWIPWQYELDASVFYNYKNFGAKLALYNITDQANFSSGGFVSSSGNDLITIHEPFHWEATVSYKF